MSNQLLSLPNELLIAVLSNLGPIDLYRCMPVCKALQTLIQGSSELKYTAAIEIAGCEDIPSSTLGTPAKLERLKKGNEAWQTLKPRFVKHVKVEHTPSGIYDLAGGIYLLGEENRRKLYYLDLPESEEDVLSWKVITVDESIIDMGLAVDEHDLIAVITTSPILDSNPARFEIAMHLLQFSSGNPHPEAKTHRIVVHKNKFERPAIGIEIVGDNLLLILTHYRMAGQHQPEDRVFVYEWRTGRLKMTLVAPYRSYACPIPLTEHLFMLPNSKKGLLEIWDIPRAASEPSPSSPRCSLALPTLAPGRLYSSISCRGEPNPMGASSRPGSKYRQRGYQATAADAILIFNVTVDPVLNRQAIDIGHTYSFFVHRKSITAAVEALDNQDEANKYRSSKPTNATMPPASLPVGSPPVDIHHPKSTDTELGDLVVPWSDWGTKVTRWFEVDRFPTRWITTTAGQRAVFMGRDGEETTIIIFDFNQWNVKRAVWDIKQKQFERQGSAKHNGQGESSQGNGHSAQEVSTAEVEAEGSRANGKGKDVDPRERGSSTLAQASTSPEEADDKHMKANGSSQAASAESPPQTGFARDPWESPPAVPGHPYIIDFTNDSEEGEEDEGEEGWSTAIDVDDMSWGEEVNEEGDMSWEEEVDEEGEGGNLKIPAGAYVFRGEIVGNSSMQQDDDDDNDDDDDDDDEEEEEEEEEEQQQQAQPQDEDADDDDDEDGGADGNGAGAANGQHDAVPVTLADIAHFHPAILQMIFGDNAIVAQYLAHINGQGNPSPQPDLLEHLGQMMEGASGSTLADEDSSEGEREDEEEADEKEKGQHDAKKTTVYTGENHVDKYGRSFESPVTSELPFVQHVTKYKISQAYDGVLMDEERILGIVTDRLDVIRNIDIHYFG